jgi:putative ABC transport system permease protein
VRIWSSLDTLRLDVRYAMRMMRRTPGFTTVAILSLAMGTGANTAIFSLINSLMLRTLPVRDPGQLVECLQKYPGEPRGNGYFTWASFEHYRDQNHVFSAIIAASGPSRSPVRGGGLEPGTANVTYVIGSFFPTLGLQPAIGRLIGPEDDAGSQVVVVSWAWWKNRFNQDPSILGRQIVVQDVPLTIVGVAPRAFLGLQTGARTDVWLPRPASSRAGLTLLARLKPGASIERARAEMSVLYRYTIEERASHSKDPQVRQLKIEVEPAGTGLSHLRDLFAKPLLILMTVVALLLLIACTNLASLLLARGAARQHEMALRVALGAGRFRLVRQVLTESLLLSTMGSLFGVFLAYFGAGALLRILTSGRPIIGLPQPLDIPLSPDTHVLLFTAGIALTTGVLFGLAPAWNAFASAPASALRETGRAGETRFRRFFGKSLVVAQVALSVVLLSAAGLFIRHLSNLEHVDLGFRRDHVLLVSLNPANSGHNGGQLSLAYQELLGRLEAIPGVRSATISMPTPLSGGGASGFATVEGYQERAEDRRWNSIRYVAPNYFETLGTPLLAGREFRGEDQAHSKVAIISQSFARRYFAGRSPIGTLITLDHVTGIREPITCEVVGVAGDANYYDIIESANRTVYLNAFQFPFPASTFAIRTAIKPEAVAPAVRRTVSETLKTVTVSRITTLSEQVDATIVPERLIATLASVFGALGALLAAIGLYGLLAYTVALRRNEIGIRMALGASRTSMTRMVLFDALAMVCAGLLAGAPLALWGRRFAESWIKDLQPDSAGPIAFGAVTMIAIAVLAAYLPARRAAGIDPMQALRYVG